MFSEYDAPLGWVLGLQIVLKGQFYRWMLEPRKDLSSEDLSGPGGGLDMGELAREE